MDCWLSSAGQEEGAQDRQRSSHREDTQGLRDPRLEEATSAEEERKAPEHPAQWAQCLALTRAACQAGLGQGGSQGVFPPPAQVRLIEHQTRGNRGGDRWGRAVLHGVWGWGCESRRGGQGPGDRAEKTVAAGPKHSGSGAQLVPTCCHRRTSHRGMGVAPSILCSLPGSCRLGLV